MKNKIIKFIATNISVITLARVWPIDTNVNPPIEQVSWKNFVWRRGLSSGVIVLKPWVQFEQIAISGKSGCYYPDT